MYTLNFAPAVRLPVDVVVTTSFASEPPLVAINWYALTVGSGLNRYTNMSRSWIGELESAWNVWNRMYLAFAGVVNSLTVAVPAATLESGFAVSNPHAGSPLTWL